MDARGSHAFIYKRASGRIARHQALNDVVARAFVSAGIPVTKEPVGLTRQDDKRPDGLTLIPWQLRRPLTWDVTIAHTLAGSDVSAAARSGGAAAAQAACRNFGSQPYCHIRPLGTDRSLVSTHRGRNSRPSERVVFFSDLGRKIASVSGDNREPSFFQLISVIVQRFNSILLHSSFSSFDDE